MPPCKIRLLPYHYSRQVEHASQFIQKYSNHLFCENTVVNAVMQYQSVRCQQFGIHIQTSLDVPSLINIDRLDLCSIFSNILDNAICACSLLPKEQRKICIGAVVNRNFLIIKETNPCSHTSNLLGTQLNHSGLGLGIIEELVRRRNGDLYIENNETSFCITVCLQTVLPESDRTESTSPSSISSISSNDSPFLNTNFHYIPSSRTLLLILLCYQLSLVFFILLCMFLGGQRLLYIAIVSIILLAGCFVSEFILAIFFSRLGKNQAIQQTVKELECDLRMWELHYKQIENTSLHLRRVQHDINNHLQTALTLIENERYFEAEKHIKNLLSILE